MKNIKADILVVGAGAAGIAAALSSAQRGINVILAEQLNYVGGLITGGLVTLFCGMEGNKDGVIQDIIDELNKHNGISYIENDPIVNPEIFKIVVERMLADKNIKILYNSHAYRVIKYNKKIKKVFFRNNYITFSIEPKVVIDCTGNGDIFYYCGEPFKEYFSEDIPIGLVVRIGGINEKAEDYLNSEGGRKFLEGSSIPKFEKTAMESILWTIVDFSDNKYNSKGPQGLTQITISLRKEALRISKDLKKNDIFKASFLLDTAPLIGIRISRLLEGKSVLTEECNHCLCIDCLLPKFTKNLLVAGRCISAELSVMDKMRVIPTCFTMGQIAGTAASLSIKGGGVLKDIDVNGLKIILKEAMPMNKNFS